ncbi:MAG: secondary thiamine-phosphate synthase enzyme YjbQ [Pseudomonadota bacterium]
MPHILTIDTPGRDLIEITGEIRKLVGGSKVRAGLIHLFMQHTSASLLIQENADPDVRLDLLACFEKLAPENAGYIHNAEGPDDMPAHIRTALTATSLSLPIFEGELALGTWQGVYVFEHRRAAHRRRIVATIIKEV